MSTTTIYKWRIFCTTDNQFEFVWQESAPTTCPVNAGHGVINDSVSQLEDIKVVTITSADSPYTLMDRSVFCDTTSGNITVNLNKSVRTKNARLLIKKTAAANTVTIEPYGSELINGGATLALTTLDQEYIIESDGSAWSTLTSGSIIHEIETRDDIIVTTDKGDLMIDDGTIINVLNVGSNDQVMIADSAQASGIRWDTLDHTKLSNIGSNTHAQIDTHISASTAHGVSGNIVGTTSTQTLTNKTINADNNTITNIDNDDVKAGAAIDASKLANGSVSNTEFQYLGTVTSDIQTQFGTKVEGATNIGMGIPVYKQKTGVNLELKRMIGTSSICVSSTPVVSAYEFENDVMDTMGIQDGTIAGGVTYDTGKVGSNCAHFDGVSGTKVNIGALDVPNISEFSISLWFKVDAFSDSRLVSKADGTNTSDHVFALIVPDANGVGFRLTTGTLGTGTQITGTTNLSTGTWYHMIAWYDGADYKIYLDGSEDATGSKTGTVPTSDSINTSIGNQPPGGGGDRAFDGKIDQVVFWDHALTSQEISDLYNSGSGRDLSYFSDDKISFAVIEDALTLDSIGGTLSVEKGGLGTTSFTSGNFLQGNGTSAITATKVAPSGVVVGTTDTQDLSNKTLDLPKIYDTSQDHHYTFAVSELSADRTVTLPLLSGNDTFVFASHSQILTNKTLISPTISTIVNTGTLTLPISTDTLVGRATTDTLTNKTLTLPIISTISNTGTLTLPTSTDTLVGRTTTDTLNNKTLTAPKINDTSADHQYIFNVSELAANRNITLPILAGNDTFVFESHSQTLTNKTIDADNNTITNIENADIKAGAAIDASKIADGSVSNTEFQQLATIGSVAVGISDTQTLTNKTLTDNNTYFQDDLDNSKKLQFQLSGITTSTTRTLTVPDANTTLVGIDTTQTLTNKTLTTPIISSISNTGTLTLPTSTDTLVGKATTDTLTNKTWGDDLNMNSNKIVNLATPTADGDAAPKSYVDSVVSGLDVKDSVVATTTVDLDSNSSISGSITYTATAGSSGRGQITATLATTDTFTLDGVNFGAVQDGSRVLIKDQSTGAQNGIYTTTISGTSLTLDRATDFDQDTEVTSGAFTFVTEGTMYDNCGFVLATNDPITIGGASGTSLSWSQFSGAGQITAGDGLTKTGDTMDIGGSVTIIANTDDLEVNSSNTANQILLSSGTVGSASTFGQLPLGDSNAVTGTLAVVNGGSGATTLTSGNFLQGNGTSAVTATKAVPTGDVVGTSDTQTLTNKTINSDNNTITNIVNADIKAAAAIDASKIADGTVSNTEFQYINSVTSNVQTQLNNKSAIGHTHTASDVTDFQTEVSNNPDVMLNTAYVGSNLGGNELFSGGVSWLSGLTYSISPLEYVINGVFYTSTGGQVTLDTADPSNDRIDVIVATTSGTVDKVTGTASPSPVKPDIDETVQIEISFATIGAGASSPTGLSATDVYLENTGTGGGEWDATENTSAARINLASTNSPYAGTKVIEVTSGATNDEISLAPSSSYDLTNTSLVQFFIKSKAAWAGSRLIRFRFYDGNNPNGNWVNIGDDDYGFDSSDTSSYQTISINKSEFKLGSNSADELKIQIRGNGTSIGFYLDNIKFQSGISQPTGSVGEVNTCINIGTAGVGVFKQKTGPNLELKKINAGSNKVTITDDTSNNEIDINLVEANIVIGNLSGAPTGTVVGISDSQTLTNKTIDADLNTITNIENADIKAAAAIDATKIADGSVTSAEFQYLNSVTSNVQTQLDAKVPYSETNLVCVENGSPGSANHVQFKVTKDTLPDTFNLGIDTGDPCKVIFSAEDGSQRQATVLASDGNTTATIFGVARSNNSGSTWQPVIVARQDQRVGIGNNSPTDTLDVTGNIVVSGTVDGRDVAADGTAQDSHIAASSGVHGLSGTVVGTTDTQTLTNKTITSPKIGTSILDTNGNELLLLTATASAVNEITLANAATGNGPSLIVSGTDTNIDFNITPKGSGNVVLDGLKWPNTDGTVDQVLKTDGSGNIGYVNVDVANIDTLTTTDATTTTLGTYSTSSDKTYVVEITIGARRTDAGSESAGYIFKVLYRNNGGTLTKVSEERTAIEDTKVWNATLGISGTNIIAQVKGQASKTINWKSSCKILSV